VLVHLNAVDAAQLAANLSHPGLTHAG
jgi:hypothetical protein